MALKHLYIIRHGETEFNRKGLVQGSGVDSDLNEIGQAQASAFHRKFGHIDFDVVLTSALKRTHQSVQLFLDSGLKWEIHPGLNEMSWGHSEGQAPSADRDHIYYNTVLAWSKGESHIAMPGGESPDQVAARQRPVIERLHQHPDQEEHILICMHGRAMRIFLCQLLCLPLSEMETFMHHNLCLYQVDLDAATGHVTINLANEKVWTAADLPYHVAI